MREDRTANRQNAHNQGKGRNKLGLHIDPPLALTTNRLYHISSESGNRRRIVAGAIDTRFRVLDTLCMSRAGLLRVALLFLGLVLLCCARADAQRESGELHLEVQDQQGTPVAAAAELISEANQLRRNFFADSDG